MHQRRCNLVAVACLAICWTREHSVSVAAELAAGALPDCITASSLNFAGIQHCEKVQHTREQHGASESSSTYADIGRVFFEGL